MCKASNLMPAAQPLILYLYKPLHELAQDKGILQPASNIATRSSTKRTFWDVVSLRYDCMVGWLNPSKCVYSEHLLTMSCPEGYFLNFSKFFINIHGQLNNQFMLVSQQWLGTALESPPSWDHLAYVSLMWKRSDGQCHCHVLEVLYIKSICLGCHVPQLMPHRTCKGHNPSGTEDF